MLQDKVHDGEKKRPTVAFVEEGGPRHANVLRTLAYEGGSVSTGHDPWAK